MGGRLPQAHGSGIQTRLTVHISRKIPIIYQFILSLEKDVIPWITKESRICRTS